MMRRVHFEPLISVIVPVYNVALYLEECIDSIINQTYRNLEIIIVDDGSEDESLQIIRKYLLKDRRIKVIHKENGGLVSARKEGIKIATGDYVTYVDADDCIEYDAYENMIEEVEDADVIICGMKRDYGKKCSLEVNKVEEGIYFGKRLENEIWKKMIYTGTFWERGVQPHVVNILSKRALLKDSQMIVPNQITIGEDAACLYPLLLQCKKLKVTSKCYYHYRMRDDSMMGAEDKKGVERYKELYFFMKGRLSQNIFFRESLLNQLDYYMLFTMLIREISKLQDDENSLFPFSDIEKGKKLVIYGAGRFGCELMRYLKIQNRNEIVLWVDRNEREGVDGIERLQNIKFDYVLVAILMKEIAKNVVDYITAMGIPKEKIKIIDQKRIEEKVKRINEIFCHL